MALPFLLFHRKSSMNFTCRMRTLVDAILTLSPSGMGMEVVTALISEFGGKFCGLVE